MRGARISEKILEPSIHERRKYLWDNCIYNQNDCLLPFMKAESYQNRVERWQMSFSKTTQILIKQNKTVNVTPWEETAIYTYLPKPTTHTHKPQVLRNRSFLWRRPYQVLSAIMWQIFSEPSQRSPGNFHAEVPQEIIVTGRRWTTNTPFSNFRPPGNRGEDWGHGHFC